MISKKLSKEYYFLILFYRYNLDFSSDEIYLKLSEFDQIVLSLSFIKENTINIFLYRSEENRYKKYRRTLDYIININFICQLYCQNNTIRNKNIENKLKYIKWERIEKKNALTAYINYYTTLFYILNHQNKFILNKTLIDNIFVFVETTTNKLVEMIHLKNKIENLIIITALHAINLEENLFNTGDISYEQSLTYLNEYLFNIQITFKFFFLLQNRDHLTIRFEQIYSDYTEFLKKKFDLLDEVYFNYFNNISRKDYSNFTYFFLYSENKNRIISIVEDELKAFNVLNKFKTFLYELLDNFSYDSVSQLLWIFIDSEVDRLEDVTGHNTNNLLVLSKYLDNASMWKTPLNKKSYISEYIYSDKMLILLKEKFYEYNIDLLFLNLNCYSNFLNPFEIVNNNLKKNPMSNSFSEIDTTCLTLIFSNLQVNYNQVNLTIKCLNLREIIETVDIDSEDYDVANFSIQPTNIFLSEIRYIDFYENKFFSEFYVNLYKLINFLKINIKIFELFYSEGDFLKEDEKAASHNIFRLVLDDLISEFNRISIFENSKLTTLIIHKQMVLVNKLITAISTYNNNINNINHNFSTRKRTYFVLNNYGCFNEKYTEINIKKLSATISALWQKNTKSLLSNYNRNLTSLYNYYLNLYFIELLLCNKTNIHYNFFLDFRGRLYTNNAQCGWVNNVILRAAISFFIKNKKYSLLSTSNKLINSDETLLIENFIKNMQWNLTIISREFYFKNITTLHYIIKIYGTVIGSLLTKKESFYLYEGLDYIFFFCQNPTSEMISEKCKTLGYDLVAKINFYANNILLAFNCFKNEEDLDVLLNQFNVGIDCVTSGFTHIVGLMKNKNIEKLKSLLYHGNYYRNKEKTDIYIYIADRIKNNITFENLKEFYWKFKDKIKNKFKEDLSLEEWENFIVIIIEYKESLVTRKLIKKPVMTIFYGSTFLTWREDIFDIILNNYEYREALNKTDIFFKLKKLDSLKLSTLFHDILSDIISKYLKLELESFLNDSLFLIQKKFKELKKNDKSQILFKNKIITNVWLIYKNDKICLTYNNEKTVHQIYLQFKNKKKNTSIYKKKLDGLDFNKTLVSLPANIIHSMDAIIVRKISQIIETLTIHDCFLVKLKDVHHFNAIYNKVYYETYENCSIYDIIYIETENNELNKLWDLSTEDKNLLEKNWKILKEEILSAKYNLNFE